MDKDLFRFSTTVEVRWRDLDAMGHVNNAVYFTYLEQGRVHYLRDLSLVSSDPADIGFILAEAHCQFRSPLKLAEPVTIRVRISELGRSSFVFRYRIEGGDGRLAAEARTTQVRYDYQKERSVPLSDEWRRIITAFEPGLTSEEA
jgi:acyl-CoA thioester hydrolase